MFKEEELRLAQQVGGMAIWEWNAETDEIRWLSGSIRLFGCPPEKLRTQADVMHCVAPEDREHVMRARDKAIREDAQYIWPNGDVRWIRTAGLGVERPENGKFLIGVSQDITEFKSREQQLESQVRLLDMAYEPILVRDNKDRITYWNSGAERLYGFSAQEAEGQVSHKLLRTRFPEPLEDIMQRLEKTGFWEGELIHSTRADRVVHVASRWQRFTNEAPLILETNFDLSQQKALEVARRWEEKAHLLGELAHEINNPLEAASGAAHLLRHQCGEPSQQYVEILETAIKRIADFIKQSDEVHRAGHSEGAGVAPRRRIQ